MSRPVFTLLLGLFSCFAPHARGWAASASTPQGAVITPSRLRCEYLIDPLGIDVSNPRLDWQLSCPVGAARDQAQGAYRILVASSPELLARDEGDLWDSGVVISGETNQIAYAGMPLAARQRCFWKVRVTDTQGGDSGWSKPALWEVGLLRPEDWKAKWIDATSQDKSTPSVLMIQRALYESADGTGGKDVTELVAKTMSHNALSFHVSNDTLGGDPALYHVKQLHVFYTLGGERQDATASENTTLTLPQVGGAPPLLRRDFAVKGPVRQARLYVTALGLYELRLNGRRVGDHLLAPDWTDYRKRVRYQVYDVTGLLRPGANTLAGLLGNGWYAGHIGNGGYQAWGTVPALLAQLEVTRTDGSVEEVVTDKTWKVSRSPITSSDFMLGETYDARLEIAGWDQPDLDTRSWKAAFERTEPARSLDGQVDQPVRQTGEMRPKSFREVKPGRWIYDFGQNFVGVLRLRICAPAGAEITLRHGEMLSADGSLYVANLRGAPSVDRYISNGHGLQTWQPRFTFHGFRYAELSGLPEAPTRETLTGIVIGTDLPRTGDFSCSEPQLNQLQSNIQWGMRGNYLSVPTDCPQRDERMGWMGDAQVFIRTAAYNGDIAAFFTKWLIDVDDAQSAEGAFTDISPAPGSGGGVPGWGDAGVICPWTIYLMYGDKRILAQHLPAMTKWVDWCQAHSNGLIRDHDRGNDYGDWLAQGEETPKDLIGTAYFAYSTSILAKAYGVVGDSAEAAKYKDLFQQIRAAYDQRYVKADGRVQGGTQSGYALSLRFDLLPEPLRAKAAQCLADDVAAHQYHLTTGFIGVSYLLPALCSEDHLETAYRLFEQDTFPSWLFSVKQGATTVWERWDGWTPQHGFQDPSMNSFNHYSLGSCGEWAFDTVAGIDLDPVQPGFRHLIVHPRPGGTLTHAEAAFDSIHGRIASQWALANGNLSLHVSVPVNTTATIHLPTRNIASVREGGREVVAAPGVKAEHRDDGEAQYLVGSGDYDFSCAMK